MMGTIECRLQCKHCCRSSQATKRMIHFMYTYIFVLLLGLVNLPCGYTHIASVLENDGVPGLSPKFHSRGPTVAPVPSPETLDKLEQISQEASTNDDFFNPAEAIRNLLSFSSSDNRLQGKRVSQFHGNGDSKLLGAPTGTYYRPTFKSSWDYADQASNTFEEEEKPTFVPFIGARALTNIPEFFAHLRENLEALPRISDSEELEGNANDGDDDSDGAELGDGRTDPSKTGAARRLKAELLVDENGGSTSGNKPPAVNAENWTSKQGWKPHAAGHIHYYSPKSNFIDSQQNILRRANNYNPAWLYTNLGLGKRRR